MYVTAWRVVGVVFGGLSLNWVGFGVERELGFNGLTGRGID